MRFTRILTNKPYKTRMLKNELLKPWWEYTRAELVAKDFFKQGAPDLHADTDTGLTFYKRSLFYFNQI